MDTLATTMMGEQVIIDSQTHDGAVFRGATQFECHSWYNDGLSKTNFFDSLDTHGRWSDLIPAQRESILHEPSIYQQWHMLEVYTRRNLRVKIIYLATLAIIVASIIHGTYILL